jgi:hypothetical protein
MLCCGSKEKSMVTGYKKTNERSRDLKPSKEIEEKYFPITNMPSTTNMPSFN